LAAQERRRKEEKRIGIKPNFLIMGREKGERGGRKAATSFPNRSSHGLDRRGGGRRASIAFD